MGNCVFIFGGKWIVSKMNGNQNLINWIIGGIFAVTAVIFLIKILVNKDGMKKIEEGA
jgi:hypothetical protein